MQMTRRTFPLSPLAASLVAALALAGCNKHDNDDNAANAGATPPAAGTVAPPSSTTMPAPSSTSSPGGTAMTGDNSAMPNTTGSEGMDPTSGAATGANSTMPNTTGSEGMDPTTGTTAGSDTNNKKDTQGKQP